MAFDEPGPDQSVSQVGKHMCQVRLYAYVQRASMPSQISILWGHFSLEGFWGRTLF